MSTHVDQAAVAAEAAFRDYSRRPGRERAQLLRLIAEGIEKLGDALIECVTRESALPAARVAGERARTCMQLRLFADLAEEGKWTDERIDAADPDRQPPKPRVRSLYRPLGPVAVFGASNFPLAFSVAGADTAAALAVGCPVIVKAHSAHPQTSRMVGEVIAAAVKQSGLPAGVFSLVFGAGNEVGQALVHHPSIKAGAFTGSFGGGMALWQIAQQRPDPIPFFAEMGSVNPIFLLPGALAARGAAIATGLHNSLTLGCGQFCTQPGLIFLLEDAVARVFLDNLADAVSKTPPGTMLTKAMGEAYKRSVVERVGTSGVRTLAHADTGGNVSQVGAALFATDAATFLATPALAQEIFGFSSLAVLCPTVKDFERCAASLQGQLTATVWSEKEELATYSDLLWLLEQRVGRLVFNGFPTGVEVGSAMMHGGPFPATSDSRFTSVGTRSFLRFVRPIAYQDEAV